MPSNRKLLVCSAALVLLIGCTPASESQGSTDSSLYNANRQVETAEGQKTLTSFLDEALSPEQRTKRDEEAQKVTKKTLDDVDRAMKKLDVTISEKKLRDLELLVSEAIHIQWSIHNVYKKRARKHGAKQIELGSARLEEIRDKVDVILEPLMVAQSEHAQEGLRAFSEKRRLEKEAIARGETVEHFEPKPFEPEVLSPEKKVKMRAARLEKITKLMDESDMTLSEEDIEDYLGYGEKTFNQMQLLAEDNYYKRYRGSRDTFELPSNKKLMGSMSASIADSTRQTLITTPLEIARIDKLKDKILKEKAEFFTKKFEEAKYDFTQNDVSQMSEISWEQDRIKHERRLTLALRRQAGQKGASEEVSKIDARNRTLKKEKSALERRLYLGD